MEVRLSKILIEGEGRREEAEFTIISEAENEFFYRTLEASQLDKGYLKTYITFFLDGERLFKNRIDLNSKKNYSGLLVALIEQCENNLKFYLKHPEYNFCKYNIEPCKNKIIFFKSLCIIEHMQIGDEVLIDICSTGETYFKLIKDNNMKYALVTKNFIEGDISETANGFWDKLGELKYDLIDCGIESIRRVEKGGAKRM